MAGSAGGRPQARARETLPRARRIARRTDYLAVQTQGRKLSSAHYLLLVRARPDGESRIGVTVSRKIGNAVTRNRVKRWIRESLRRMTPGLPSGVDVVVIARPIAAAAGFAATRDELARLVAGLGAR